jgi:uncharacterized delta-60 repeat protein
MFPHLYVVVDRPKSRHGSKPKVRGHTVMARARRSTVALAALALAATVLVATPGISASAPAGALDTSFGDNGRVQVNVAGAFVSTDQLQAILVQPDGKVLAAGWGGNPYGDFILMRTNPDGTLDSGFGVNGIARNAFSSTWDEANAVALQPDGKIVAGGFARTANGNDDVAIARYLPNGTLDPSFSGDGLASGLFAFVYLSFLPQAVYGIAAQPDGKVVALVGSNNNSPGFVVIRLLADGTLDPTFGDSGRAVFEHQNAYGIALQPDGRILLVGSTLDATPSEMAVIRLDSSGALDASFGQLGVAAVPNQAASASADAIALQPDGRIVIAGAASTGYAAQMALARVWPDGSLDTSFGNGGHVSTTITGAEDRARSIALQSDGKIVAVGGTLSGTTRPWVIARYNVSGSIDGTFDNDGIALFDNGSALAVAVGADGAYVTGSQGSVSDLVIYKFGIGTPPPPTTTTVLPTTTVSTTPPTTVTPPPGLPTVGSRYVAQAATRVLDTRAGGAAGKVGARGAVDAVVTGAGRAPTNATAVVVNVTATDADAAGYITVWPAGTARPEVSSLNVGSAAGTIANLVTVPLSSSGALSLFSEAGAHLVVDLVGYYAPVDAPVKGGRFQPVTPVRALDTRAFGGAVAPAIADLSIGSIPGLPATGVSAIVANLTATDSTNAGFVTVWPRVDGARPLTSNLNLDAAGQTRANQIIVGVGDGTIRLATASGSQLIVDVVGYITNDAAPAALAGLFVPLTAARVLDTRSGIGTRVGVVRAGERIEVNATGALPVANPLAVVGNLTATQSTAPGFVTMWATTNGARPDVSTINLDAPDQTRANHVMTTIGGDGRLSLYAEAGAHLVLDLAGAYRS